MPILIGVALLAFGISQARQLHIGDLGKGVPELRPDSRYNQDVEMITSHFAIGVDLLQVIAEAKPEDDEDSPCVDRDVMDKIEDFEFQMRQVDGVATVRSLSGFVKTITQSFAETYSKWRMLPESRAQIAQGVGYATRLGNEFMNSRCTAMPISIYTTDHQAQTIEHIVEKVKAFKAGGGDTERVTFRLASGNVGVMAATNEAVEAADKWVNLALFASVMLLCLITFRSFPITLCIILPLALVTVLCNALMAMLGIGVKVNTLPVVALGVGVGVDYGIYLFERMKHEMEDGGLALKDAFVEALKQRGTASIFTAVTMTISVATWIFSALKFQADMGILLALHVPRERVRRDPAAAGAGGLPGGRSPEEAGRGDGLSLMTTAAPASGAVQGRRCDVAARVVRLSAHPALLDQLVSSRSMKPSLAAAHEFAADAHHVAFARRARHAIGEREHELAVMHAGRPGAVRAERLERVLARLERLLLQALRRAMRVLQRVVPAPDVVLRPHDLHADRDLAATSGCVLLPASTMPCRPAARSSISSNGLPPDADTAMMTWCGVLRIGLPLDRRSLSRVSMQFSPATGAAGECRVARPPAS